MKTYLPKQLPLLILTILLINSCSKNETETPIANEVIPDPPFVNLNSTITFTATESIEEGNYAQFTVGLGTKLSEDLPLSVHFSTDQLVNYLNPEDYSTAIEYSIDEGTNWLTANNNQPIIPKERQQILLRFSTIDDNQLEVHEAIFVAVEALPQNNIVLSNSASSTFKINVMDNEDNSYDFYGGFMTFDLNDPYEFSLLSVARTVSTTTEKEFIDRGKLPDELIEDIQFLLQSGGIKTVNFVAEYDPEGNLGSVYNLGFENNSDEWVLNMNLYYAYNDINTETPISYNENGHFGNTLVHELGHILTLNNTNQINKSVINEAACNQFYDEDYGCMKEDATLSTFNTAFYNGKETNILDFVTDYASTSITEDIAETFMYYVAQDSIPVGDEFSTIALHKINFVKEEKWLSPLKHLKDHIHMNLSTEVGPIYYKTKQLKKARTCIEIGQIQKQIYRTKKMKQ